MRTAFLVDVEISAIDAIDFLLLDAKSSAHVDATNVRNFSIFVRKFLAKSVGKGYLFLVVSWKSLRLPNKNNPGITNLKKLNHSSN